MPQKYIKCSRRFADVWGLDVAVVMEQVKYWLTRNSKEPANVRDGTVWFYHSIRKLQESYFPYWTQRQLAVLLDYMVKVGLLRVGRFNKIGYDRTRWYTVVDTRILEEDDYVPERKNNTKRRAISRASVCSGSHTDVKGSDADGRMSNTGVQGPDAGVEWNAPSSGTYTTTKQHLTTEKVTEKEQLNTITTSLRSEVEGGKEPPSVQSNILFQNEDKVNIEPLPRTEGANLQTSVLGEGTPPPLRRMGDAPSGGDIFDKIFPSELAAQTAPQSPRGDIGRIFDELFKEPQKKYQTNNTIQQRERVTL